jgi:hypothetical protein
MNKIEMDELSQSLPSLPSAVCPSWYAFRRQPREAAFPDEVLSVLPEHSKRPFWSLAVHGSACN